ncbi:MAG: META domain-containing protein [Actinomycetota bacterium]
MTGCADDGSSGDGGDPAASVAGVTWILEAASTEALVDEVVPANARVTIRFEDDGTVSGSAGCNNYAGSYTTSADGTISIEAGGMTMMACEEPLMRLDAAYVTSLSEVTEFEVVDDGAGLVLSGAETPLSFTAEQPVPLEGTAWRVDGIAIGNDAVSSTIAGADADLVFDAGVVSGSTGCNTLNGSYSTDGDPSAGAIAFSGIATTKMACEPDVAEQEQAILTALDTAASYTIAGSTMTLSGADDSFLLSLVAS